MKSLKKVLSVVLALLMLCICIAVSSISASALTLEEMENEKYDDNIMFTGDEFIRNYSYATYLTDNWPRQLSFNEDGWMRVQSQTAEEIAAGEPGTFDRQWSLNFIPTAEYKKQFKNAVKYVIEQDTDIFAYQYFYVNSAQHVGSKGTTDPIECSIIYTVKCDADGDGELEYEIKIGHAANAFTDKHQQFDYQYLNDAYSLEELKGIVDSEIDFDLVSVTYQPRYYKDGSQGVGLLDLYISPLYVETIPGTDVKANDEKTFDIRSYLGKTTFTSGKLDRDGDGDPLNDWQWKTWEKGEKDDHPPIYGSEKYGVKGDIVRDPDTNCPIMADGTPYNPIPIVQLVEESPVEIADLKATVDGANATLTWTNKGAAASKYDITYKKDGKYVGATSVTAETYTFTGLEAGKYEATVAGFNVEGSRSKQVKVEFTIEGGASKPQEPTECVHSLTTIGYKKATYFAAGYTGDKQCSKCKVVTAKGSAIAKLKLAKPKFSVKAGKKQFKVTYKKVAGATGFQVRYRIKGKWVVKSYKGKKNMTKAIKKLKKGTYKVQVRAYVQSGKLKAYSAWAKQLKAKVK
ncbi:MAG: hypothetical protein IJD90_01180 [Clostridia bacterium]|nr:hypothetical protein [Clostridia bacterium]